MISQVCLFLAFIPLFIVFRFSIWQIHSTIDGKRKNPESSCDQIKNEVFQFWCGINHDRSLGESYSLLIGVIAIVVAAVLVLVPFSGDNQLSTDGMIQKIESVIENMCVGFLFFITFIFPELEKPFGFLVALVAVAGSAYLILSLDEYVIGGLRRRESVNAQDQKIEEFNKNYDALKKKTAANNNKRTFWLCLSKHPVVLASAVCFILNLVALFFYLYSMSLPGNFFWNLYWA